MKRGLAVCWGLLLLVSVSQARGLVIPKEPEIPPLALVQHQVEVTITDQVAQTRVNQVFRNHTSRPLEATYVFPVPKGAAVREFTLWVDGQPVKAELVEADHARQIYLSIVRQSQDPGLLEYLGSDLFQARIFPVPPNADQKIEIAFASVCGRDQDTVEFIYPLKTDGRALQTLEKFSFRVQIQSQHPIVNIYSPSHAVSVTRKSDYDATVTFEQEQALLDRNFVLYYTLGGEQVGMTALFSRPDRNQPGYVALLLAPRYQVSQSQRVPRDVVFVLDTSGSMAGKKIQQAKQALICCLESLPETDRFALLHFATTVNKYPGGMQPAQPDALAAARKWVESLGAGGGTAIQDALLAALALRTQEPGRIFLIVFITDGQPTVGETRIERILASIARQNTNQTRIFPIGIGHDLNASLLDQLADQSRAFSTFIRRDEEIHEKILAFQEKISQPVLADLRLQVSGAVQLEELYPPQLPDLYHNGQLVVFARYKGSGSATIRLTGMLGQEKREFTYRLDFPTQADGKAFVEELWARRKVGYLLEQIRLNGESEELKKEVIELAKRYGISTPYTSYLVVPDTPLPLLVRPAVPGKPEPQTSLPALLRSRDGQRILTMEEAVRLVQQRPGGLSQTRLELQERSLLELERKAADAAQAGALPAELARRAQEQAAQARATQHAQGQAAQLLRDSALGYRELQRHQLGVELSQHFNQLKQQSQLPASAQRLVLGRPLLEVGGVWIDQGLTPQTRTQVVKAFSPAYFRILERRPEMKELFQLGRFLAWITPSGTALLIDTQHGAEHLTDAEIDTLFRSQPG